MQYDLARCPAGLWRCRELLPIVDPAFRIDLEAGGTEMLYTYCSY